MQQYIATGTVELDYQKNICLAFAGDCSTGQYGHFTLKTKYDNLSMLRATLQNELLARAYLEVVASLLRASFEIT